MELKLSPDLVATVVPNGHPEVMGITFHDSCHRPVICPQGVSLVVGRGNVPVPMVGGAFFISGNQYYELSLDGGKVYKITPFSRFRIHEKSL
jgi:hypothetical protein